MIELGNQTEIEVLEIKIGENTYNVPLASSLKIEEYKLIKSEDSIYEFVQRYIPEDIFDTLTVKDMEILANEWAKASEKASGLKVGE